MKSDHVCVPGRDGWCVRCRQPVPPSKVARYIVHFGRANRGEFATWPEALKCCIVNHSAEVFNPGEVDGAEDASWRASRGLTEEQERDLLEAGLL